MSKTERLLGQIEGLEIDLNKCEIKYVINVAFQNTLLGKYAIQLSDLELLII